jgi:lipoic acid synthetase
MIDTVYQRKPPWLKRPMAFSGKKNFVEDRISHGRLHTVCAEAKCPNRAECHALGTATFLILGDVCTRRCGFCSVNHGAPGPIDHEESLRLCDAVERMGLRHVVITSVTRDDVSDGGASIFARMAGLLRKRIPKITIELLIPDFNGSADALATVIESGPDIVGHNIETVPRLYGKVRPQASYERSISLLKAASRHRELRVKSGLMVGLGESVEEVECVMRDLSGAGCHMLTIGQYLRPSSEQLPVTEFIHPHTFQRFEEIGRGLGFISVLAGPYVRSSYKAYETAHDKNHTTFLTDKGGFSHGYSNYIPS